MGTFYRRYSGQKEYIPFRARRSVRVFTLLLALLSLWYVWEEEEIFPPGLLYHPSKALSLLIEENAVRFTLTEELLQSVIFVESKYDSGAVSSTGALGVMQLMPDTAVWISEQSGLPAAHLERDEENVPLGAWYLDYLIDLYDGNLVLALAAYNAGRGNVDSWMAEYGWPADHVAIDSIPFPETREFVRAVIRNKDRMAEERRQREKEGSV